MKILILGAGRMGLGAAFDLTHNSPVEDVTIADVDIERARAVVATVKSDRLKPVQVDVTNQADVVALMRGHDAAISCVGYYHNLQLAQCAIEARVNFCDLGGNNTVVDAELALDAAACAAGINIIPDCGLAPGMVSVLAEHGAARFTTLDEIHIRVGGLPQQPKPPLDYQIIFSVDGLINEYVERARVIRDGAITDVESMTELERLEFPAPFGMLEAFQTSGGTSTLPDCFHGRVRELDYKTIRYPGHCEKFRTMIDLGLTSSDPIEIDGVLTTARRAFSEMLLRNLPAGEPDVVLVRLDFRGIVDNKPRALRYDIIDYYDQKSGLSAMMRTTAFPASIIAQMMARGETLMKGATPQEKCIQPEKFVAELAARKINIVETYVE